MSNIGIGEPRATLVLVANNFFNITKLLFVVVILVIEVDVICRAIADNNRIIHTPIIVNTLNALKCYFVSPSYVCYVIQLYLRVLLTAFDSFSALVLLVRLIHSCRLVYSWQKMHFLTMGFLQRTDSINTFVLLIRMVQLIALIYFLGVVH